MAAQEKRPDTDKKPDNTAMNKDQGTTADKQTNKKADTELARTIRKAIVADKTMSTYGKNVKVIAKDGTVTLKGPVRSEEEKASILAKAREAAGSTTVTDEITVAPSK